MLSGDPFHAACPTIETMGDPFVLASNRMHRNVSARFTYDAINPEDAAVRYYIVDTHTGERTHTNSFLEHQARDFAWQLNKGRLLKSDYVWFKLPHHRSLLPRCR